MFTNAPARWSNLFALDLGNSVMHDVYAWGDGEHARVVASNDPGHFALDPRTLDTVGPETLGGAVGKGWDFSPMPCPDPHSGHLIGWIKKPGLTDVLQFVEIDGSFKVVKQTPWHKLGGGLAVVHDQRATAAWYVAVESGVKLSLPAAMWGASTVWESLRPTAELASTLLLAPRDGGPMRRVALPGVRLGFHGINAYDDGDRVVVDLCVYDDFVRFSAAAARPDRERRGLRDAHGPTATPTRFVVDPSNGALISQTRLGDATGDAPEVADAVMGRPYRFAYWPTCLPTDDLPDRGGYFYFGRLAKLDVTTGDVTRWSAGDGAIVSPPQFVPRPGGADEDDGWLLAWVLRETGAEVVVLDAKTVSSVATLKLGIHLPAVSHTRWAAGVQLAG